jgi:hypothetical protein
MLQETIQLERLVDDPEIRRAAQGQDNVLRKCSWNSRASSIARSQIFIATTQLDEQRLARHLGRDAFWQGFYNYLAKDQTNDAEEIRCLSEVQTLLHCRT